MTKLRKEQLVQGDGIDAHLAATAPHSGHEPANANIQAHIAAAAPHSGHALSGHNHTGVYVAQSSAVNFTPSVWGPGGSATFQLINAKYLVLGNAYFYTFYVKCTNQGSTPGQPVYISLPFTSPAPQIMYGRETLINGSMVAGTIDAGVTYVYLTYYNNTGPIATNAGWMVSGVLLK